MNKPPFVVPALVCCLALGATATACSTGSTTAAGGASAASSGGSRKVALVLGVKGSPFYSAMACGARAKAKQLGLDLTVSAGDAFSADAQLPVVNAVTAAKPAVAAVVPTDATALVQPLTALTAAGTKLVTVDQVLADPKPVRSRIVTDNEKGGRLAAAEMDKLTGGKGKVLVITQPPGSSAQDARTAGFVAGIKKYPGITYLGAQYQSDDPQKAAQIITSTLAAHPDLTGVFSTNDQGAIGALTGLKQADATKKVKLVAYDAASAEVAALKNGTLSALIAQNPVQEGEVAMESAQKLIAGRPVPATQLTELVVIGPGERAKADRYAYTSTC
ncbi:ABC transporter substrate-binding protein [Streptomyces sp. NPDC047002]|uniref:ABC transporter substrate-binding protein n=1 Tax=Streptomyces sp. NPDC047002 TaxID=3155475 RepID=UPI0034543EFF